MTDFATLLQGGNAWLFVPSAILLGILHGLEPGHSKTMMAAFIIAVRGTVAQAVLLGLAATISHTAVVWIIALAGLYFGSRWNTEATEPYLQLISAAIIIAVAAWMIWRTWTDQNHSQGESRHRIETERGTLTFELFEDGVPPRWRVRRADGTALGAGDVTIETIRPDGVRQQFGFAAHDGFLESIDDVPEPHAFKARLRFDHDQAHDIEFQEHDHAAPSDAHFSGASPLPGSPSARPDQPDAHQRAHAEDIKRRFGNGQATTGQIVLFGLTGGLIPCPASITVLLLCLQLKQFTLGAALVLCFSIGLAVTMVSVGAVAALGVRQVSRQWEGFGELARRAPYLSGALIIAVGLYTGYLGWAGLAAGHH